MTASKSALNSSILSSTFSENHVFAGLVIGSLNGNACRKSAALKPHFQRDFGLAVQKKFRTKESGDRPLDHHGHSKRINA